MKSTSLQSGVKGSPSRGPLIRGNYNADRSARFWCYTAHGVERWIPTGEFLAAYNRESISKHEAYLRRKERLQAAKERVRARDAARAKKRAEKRAEVLEKAKAEAERMAKAKVARKRGKR